ncbi:MAG: glycerol kinase GlpK [Chloroflexi bacterium]|nr:glycerol kinase GlpK [Chloroflexota bacterium]
MDVVLAIDHGTTRTKAVAIGRDMQIVAAGTAELTQIYPQPGWVEQRPADILRTTQTAIERCLAALPPGTRIGAAGLANQGETVLIWDRTSGAPLGNAIGWQDRRTADWCAALAADGAGERVHARTGLFLDSYFSASKVRWLLDHTPNGQARAEAGELVLGTTDTWLLWNLSGGRLHLTDRTTASRTLLLDLRRREWDDELLTLFDIPRAMLPVLAPCAGIAGEIDLPGYADTVPVMGLMVDQQAALFGHACLQPGMVKASYGTGTFVLMNIGDTPRLSAQGLITTLAWSLPDRTAYALEGGVYTTGAAVQWLVDGLGIMTHPDESAALAQSVPDNGGVYLVPAFAGLAAPHWKADARGFIGGLTRGSSRYHIVRAALEGIAYRVRDVVAAMQADGQTAPGTLRADGPATRNEFLMQFQADMLGVPVEVAADTETTARGAGLLAGLALGWWTLDDIAAAWRCAARYEPQMRESQREILYAQWLRAVKRAAMQ